MKKYKKKQEKRRDKIYRFYELQNKRFKDDLNKKLENPTFTLLKQ